MDKSYWYEYVGVKEILKEVLDLFDRILHEEEIYPEQDEIDILDRARKMVDEN